MWRAAQWEPNIPHDGQWMKPMNIERTSTLDHASASHNDADASTRKVRVWDLPTRVFHWSLAGLIALAWMTADAGSAFLTVHVFCGTTVIGLVVFRVVWGFVGTRHALFVDFVRGPDTVRAYAKKLLSFRPPHHVGHNPLGGWMVLALMAFVVIVALSGMTIAKAGFVGPLAPFFGGGLDDDFHEALTNGLLALIIGHVAGVVVHGLITRENLLRAMVDGDKIVPQDSDAQDIRSPGVVRLTIALAIAAGCVLYLLR